MTKINVTCKPLLNGIMAYWDRVEDAAQYIVTLYINNQPISVRTNPRTELYCSFTGLASLDGNCVFSPNRVIVQTGTFPREVIDSYSLKFEEKKSKTHYYVWVKAEDRSGEIIAQSEKVICRVKEL